MTQAKMTECRASSAPRVRRHVEVLHCSRYVRVDVCAFFMRWSTSSSGRPAYGGPAQRMCPPQSTANCNHLWGRGGVAGCPQSPSTCGRIVGARSSDKSFGGLKLREHNGFT